MFNLSNEANAFKGSADRKKSEAQINMGIQDNKKQSSPSNLSAGIQPKIVGHAKHRKGSKIRNLIKLHTLAISGFFSKATSNPKMSPKSSQKKNANGLIYREASLHYTSLYELDDIDSEITDNSSLRVLICTADITKSRISSDGQESLAMALLSANPYSKKEKGHLRTRPPLSRKVQAKAHYAKGKMKRACKRLKGRKVLCAHKKKAVEEREPLTMSSCENKVEKTSDFKNISKSPHLWLLYHHLNSLSTSKKAFIKMYTLPLYSIRSAFDMRLTDFLPGRVPKWLQKRCISAIDFRAEKPCECSKNLTKANAPRLFPKILASNGSKSLNYFTHKLVLEKKYVNGQTMNLSSLIKNTNSLGLPIISQTFRIGDLSHLFGLLQSQNPDYVQLLKAYKAGFISKILNNENSASSGASILAYGRIFGKVQGKNIINHGLSQVYRSLVFKGFQLGDDHLKSTQKSSNVELEARSLKQKIQDPAGSGNRHDLEGLQCLADVQDTDKPSNSLKPTNSVSSKTSICLLHSSKEPASELVSQRASIAKEDPRGLVISSEKYCRMRIEDSESKKEIPVLSRLFEDNVDRREQESLWDVLTLGYDDETRWLVNDQNNGFDLLVVRDLKKCFPSLKKFTFVSLIIANYENDMPDGTKSRSRVSFRSSDEDHEREQVFVEEFRSEDEPTNIHRCLGDVLVSQKKLLKPGSKLVFFNYLEPRVFSQPLSGEDIRLLESSLSARIKICKEVLCDYETGKRGTISDNALQQFFECFEFCCGNFAEFAIDHLYDLMNWIREVGKVCVTAANFMIGIGNQYSHLLCLIDASHCTEKSVELVKKNVFDIQNSLHEVDGMLEGIQQAVQQIELDFNAFVPSLAELVEIANFSSYDLIDTYESLCSILTADGVNKEELDTTTGYKRYRRAVAFVRQHEDTDFVTELKCVLNDIHSSHNMIQAAFEGIDTRTRRLLRKIKFLKTQTGHCK